MEQFIRLLISCGMPVTDLDLLQGPGLTMSHVMKEAKPRNTLFTGVHRSSLSDEYGSDSLSDE
jgi:1-pyrroline-5-carboxylate dehydrogenase